MDKPNRKQYQVVCAIIIRDGKVFCCRRGPGRALEGYWEFPGGKIEKGEDARHALKREISEELKANIEVGEYLTTSKHNYPDFSITMEAYICALLGKEPTLTEHTESRWLSKDELDSVTWAPADQPIVETTKRFL